MNERNYSAKYHLELCMKEDLDYSVGKSHLRLASLYNDYEQLSADLCELQFSIKWNRANEAAVVLERLVKSHSSDAVWTLIHKIFLKGSSCAVCSEREIFTVITPELYDSIVGGLTKRFDSDESLKIKMLLFGLEVLMEDKLNRIVNRALTFFTERANIDKDLDSGAGKYHVILGVIVAKLLNNRNLSQISPSRLYSVIAITLNVAVAWPLHDDKWFEILTNISPLYLTDANNYHQDRWYILSGLIDRYIQTFENDITINLQANLKYPSGCGGLVKCFDKVITLKTETKKSVLLFFVWLAYCIWKTFNQGNFLAWIPENDWSGDVHKVIQSKADVGPDKPTLTKRARTKDRRDIGSFPSTSVLKRSKKELCDSYELCSATILVFLQSMNIEPDEHMRFASSFPDLYQFVSESLLFEHRVDEALTHLNDVIDHSIKDSIASSKVYTSTAVSHDNDCILGSLMVLSQINFAWKGYLCFNRIMRYVEAKGSLVYPGMLKYITNIAILEELARVQEYCSEYVSVQIASPQGNRRIGQSTRHSVRGTKDGQKQSLEDQMKRWREEPVHVVKSYFIKNKEDIIKMLEIR
ncbi:unnamed protein product [Dracunculus medinensis]|uniref:TPR_REGION domain-containing protein n=1 Tax=Dracunculus medinensis TaxID=318479 RepID=A0A0N4U842_DRAME|nr:unnamed protein product [Dracunculus medinensis]